VANLKRNSKHINNKIIACQDFLTKYQQKPRSSKPFRVRFLSILNKYNINLEQYRVLRHARYSVPYWLYPQVQVDLSIQPPNKKQVPIAKLKI
jgi:hypothetical protein